MAVTGLRLETAFGTGTITRDELHAAREGIAPVIEDIVATDVMTKIAGYHPDECYPVPSEPSESLFGIADPDAGPDDEPDYEDYIAGADIERIAATLIARHGEFKHLREAAICYRWKREGGKTGGKERLGQCRRLDRIGRHFSGADFLIWVAADNCRGRRMTARQIEALVFHELLHIGLSDAEEPKLTLVAHEFEGFGLELRVYGMWHRDLKIIGNALQTPLFEAGRE